MDHISIYDRGLQYGDGLFETIAVVNGKPQLWQRHLSRLRHGCERLLIPVPTEQQLLDEVDSLLTSPNCVLKIIVTRGCGGRGYKIPEHLTPTLIVYTSDWPAYDNALYEQGVNIRICDTPASKNARLAGIKHLNRLENVLARTEWNTNDIQEGLMLDAEGNVIEGSMSNVFMVSDGVLYTPDLAEHGVQGVVREYILHHASIVGLDVKVESIAQQRLLAADEIFLTNSIIGIWPVRHVQNRELDVSADGNPVTRKLIQYLTDNIANEK